MLERHGTTSSLYEVAEPEVACTVLKVNILEEINVEGVSHEPYLS